MPSHALPHTSDASGTAPDDPSSLSAHLAHWARHTPGRPAFTFAEYPAPALRARHRTLTWHRVDIRTRAVASRLRETVAPGERVALLCGQGLEYVVGFLAAFTSGAVAAPLLTRPPCAACSTHPAGDRPSLRSAHATRRRSAPTSRRPLRRTAPRR